MALLSQHYIEEYSLFPIPVIYQEYIALKHTTVNPIHAPEYIGVGGLHGNQFAKNRPAKIS